jgi:hypothetical protein
VTYLTSGPTAENTSFQGPCEIYGAIPPELDSATRILPA